MPVAQLDSASGFLIFSDLPTQPLHNSERPRLEPLFEVFPAQLYLAELGSPEASFAINRTRREHVDVCGNQRLPVRSRKGRMSKAWRNG